VILFAAQWSNLKQQNIHTQGYRFATSTRKNVLSQIRQWVYFATYFSLAILPASAEDLCMFAECLSLSSGYGHIKNVISGVRYFHHTMGHTFPTDSVRLEDTLQGLKRKLKGTPKQVLPIGPVILRRMFKNVNLKKNLDLAHWCGCLIAFYTLFRKANLCPKEKKFDPETLLTRGDIILDKVDKRVLIFVNFAKNNQFQKQCHVVPIPSNKDPALDLYTHLCELFERVDADEDSPALSHSSKSFLTHKTFTTRLKFLIESAGLVFWSFISPRRRILLVLHWWNNLDGPDSWLLELTSIHSLSLSFLGRPVVSARTYCFKHQHQCWQHNPPKDITVIFFCHSEALSHWCGLCNGDVIIVHHVSVPNVFKLSRRQT
jgi:hypothetical protein